MLHLEVFLLTQRANIGLESQLYQIEDNGRDGDEKEVILCLTHPDSLVLYQTDAPSLEHS